MAQFYHLSYASVFTSKDLWYFLKPELPSTLWKKTIAAINYTEKNMPEDIL